MVDFFTRQERSRRATRVLLAMFAAAVILIVTAVTAVAALVARLYSFQANPASSGAQSFGAWAADNWGMLAMVAAITLAFITLASLYRAATLSQGGSQVARMLGATEISHDSTDPLHQRLINVTEEMAIASGVPVPAIFVLEQESGINGFAAGLAPSNAAIAVTRGALEQLDRAELQGVIAHEFSHVLNGDMRINQQLIGLSFGILVLTVMGRWMLHALRFSRRGRSGGGVAAVVGIGLALMVIGSIGVLFGRLIKAAVSRQREMLADASAVQFTRDPTGLAGALKKIGGYTGQLSSVDSEEIAHMLFSRGSRAFRGLFATHPPLIDRIHALEPAFNEDDYPRPRTLSSSAGPDTAAGAQAAAFSAGGETAMDTATDTTTEAAADTLLDHAGEVGSPEAGGALRAALPEELYHAAHSRDSSLLLVLALALAADTDVRARQLAMLDNQLGAQRASRCRRLHEQFSALDAPLRLPLLELSVPALRQRPREQLVFVCELIQRITALGSGQRLEDYVLLRALAAYLPDIAPATGTGAGQRKLSQRDALATVLAVVAAFGHEDNAAAHDAYTAGLAVAYGRAAIDAERTARQNFESLPALRDLQVLDAALDRLATLGPGEKRRVLSALLATIRHDHRVEIAEVELFRAIAATLDCPLPPLAALAPPT